MGATRGAALACLLLLLTGSVPTTKHQQRGILMRGTAVAGALALAPTSLPSPPPWNRGSSASRTMMQQQHRHQHQLLPQRGRARHRCGFERELFVGWRRTGTTNLLSLSLSSRNDIAADGRVQLENNEQGGDLLGRGRSNDDNDGTGAGAGAGTGDLTPDEIRQIRELLVAGGREVGDSGDDDDDEDDDAALLIRNVRDALPKLSPALLVKLHRYCLQDDDAENDEGAALEEEDDGGPSTSTSSTTSTATLPMVRQVARAVQHVVEERRIQGAELLRQLLSAGEIRRLDSLIGRAGRNGALDPAFFQVLQVNLRDAYHREHVEQQPQAEADDGSSATPGTAAASATRYQILSHIYTRCQEEVEKALPPGMALLNKLLRTPEAPIRSNLVVHYLLPPKQTITSPDGKTITLSGTPAAPLVSLDDLISAVTTFVAQVRVVEEQQQQQQEGSSTSSIDAATMVESARQLCKEVLMILAESHGPESAQVRRLKEGLQPVFRPTSTTATATT
jgi:hypothetical protein